MTFGEKIRMLRKKKNMTQRELAIAVGVGYSYISKIENNRLEYTPSIKTILRLARVLDVDELELLDSADKVPSVLEPIASDKDALRFFRHATKTIKNPDVWKDLLDYLEEQEKSKG